MSNFLEVLKKIIGIKDKVIENPGVIGHYDSKPFHNFKYACIYANEVLISESDDEKTAKVMIYSREYKKTTFINVLVYNEEGFDITKYTYEDLKPLLLNKNIQPQQRSVVMVLFQHNNENTISMCKKFYKSDKNNFEQACVYNPVKVQMDFYKPVPQFYKLYDIFCENIYFDLGFIDDLRE